MITPDSKTPVVQKPGVTITTENLAKRFNREWIFRKFTHTFNPGEVIAVTGPNGAGKSTLLQVLSGYMPPSEGNLDFAQNGSVIDINDSFRHISFAAPYMDLIDEFTLEEQLRFHFKLKPSRNNITISEMMQVMYLEKSATKAIGNFSSGMKQRVKLALAFFTEADIIFLDEPGTNLDKTAFEWYLKQFSILPSNCITFIASNNPEEYRQATKTLNIADFK